MADDLAARVAAFLYREALALDEQRWDDWLAMYDANAVFWVPSYTMQGALVTEPELAVNLIYIAARSGLEDRIFRIRTGASAASTPLPRTSHLVGNVLAHEEADGAVVATAAFQLSAWSLKRAAEVRSGRYEYRLRRAGDGFRIAQKKVMLTEEVVDGWFDVVTV